MSDLKRWWTTNCWEDAGQKSFACLSICFVCWKALSRGHSFPGSCENVGDVEEQLQENTLFFLWPRKRVSNSVSQGLTKDSHMRWSLIAEFRDSADRNGGCTLYFWVHCPGNFCKSGEWIAWSWFLNGMLDIWSFYVYCLLMKFDCALSQSGRERHFYTF